MRWHALLTAGALITTAAYAAAPEPWTIVETSGVVKVGGSGRPTSNASLQTLPLSAWIETGADGRTVLKRKADSMTIAGSSRLSLLSDQTGLEMTLQTFGSIQYRIAKRESGFRIDSPYAAVTTKGGTFSVRVAEGGAEVQTTDGSVDVSMPDGAKTVTISAGQTAAVTQTDLTVK